MAQHFSVGGNSLRFALTTFLVGIVSMAAYAAPATQPTATAPAALTVHVTGTVVDAETGQPIGKFMVDDGTIGDRHRIDGRHFHTKWCAQGRFDFQSQFDFGQPSRIVWVEAAGYFPFVSEPIKPNETEKTFAVRLRRGKSVEGQVRLATGEPAGGVDVLLATKYESADLVDGVYRKELYTRLAYPATQTDEQGRFSLPPREWAIKVVAVGEQGLGIASGDELAKGGAIVLQPWGRIEGVLMDGDKPAARAKVMIEGDMTLHEGEPNLTQQYDPVETDSKGRFVFPRVIAMSTPVMKHNPKGEFQDDVVAVYGPVDVAWGQTVKVRFGDRGRPVTGMVDIPVVGADHGYCAFDSWIRRVGPTGDLPNAWAKLSIEDKNAWIDKWRADHNDGTGDGASCSFPVELDEVAGFRIPVVPSGIYAVSLRIVEKNAAGKWWNGEEVARGSDFVVVPEPQDRWSAEPFNVGTIKTEAISILRLGAPAPETTFEKADGTQGTLADYRGKIVIVDFWATWCGPCARALPDLKAVYGRFKRNDKVVIVGLSVDEDKDVWKKYLQKEQLQWVQGNVGPWHQSKVPDAWGVHGIPEMFVLNGEGKVIFKGLPGGTMMTAAIETALQRQ